MKLVLLMIFIFTGSLVVAEEKHKNIKNILEIEEVSIFPESETIRKTLTKYDKSGKKTETEYRVIKKDSSPDNAHKFYIYDENGKNIQTELYDSNKQLITKSVFEYDHDGNVLKETNIDSTGEEFYKTSYYYDKSGKLLKIFYNPNSNENTKTLLIYDDTGKLIEEQSFVIDGNYQVSKSLYKYNEQGAKTELVDYERPFEGSGRKYVYQYKDGFLIKEIYYNLTDNKEKLIMTTEYFYSFY